MLQAVPSGKALQCALSQLTQWGLQNAALNLAKLVEADLLQSALHLAGSEVPCCVLQQAAHAHWLSGDAVKVSFVAGLYSAFKHSKFSHTGLADIVAAAACDTGHMYP